MDLASWYRPSMNRERRHQLLRDERRRFELPRDGGMRVVVGYPNSYRVAHSSLAFQWVVEIAATVGGIAVSRCFAPPDGSGSGFDDDRPLSSANVLAWSLSFELDAVNLLRALDAAGIARRRDRRTAHDPLIVVGGPVASINPLPLAPAVDVFVLGAAELLWPPLLELVRRRLDRELVLEEIAGRDGYFVPSHHLDGDGVPLRRLRRLEKRDAEMTNEAMVPSSYMVTPHTEYGDRGLVEMSRGCPEKCRYCWASFNCGRLRCYPASAILDRVDRLAELGSRVGFVATAVGDHPELSSILRSCRDKGLDVSLSSLRIPAMVPEILGPLAESGARSVTIAPETGSERLRTMLNKTILDEQILTAVETAQRSGIPGLKMYFIIGLPHETDDDLAAIGRLVRSCSRIMLTGGRDRGRVGTLHASCSVLVPKPYTPYSREPVLDRDEYRRRLSIVEAGFAGLDNFRFDRPSYREAVWQAVLSRGDTQTFNLVEELADHGRLGRLLSEHRSGAIRNALAVVTGSPVWRFIGPAPTVGSMPTVR